MGQIPVLEIDGKKYNQSQAILRYLAKKFKVAGGDDEEAYEIDNAVDTMTDMRIGNFIKTLISCCVINKNNFINY